MVLKILKTPFFRLLKYTRGLAQLSGTGSTLGDWLTKGVCPRQRDESPTLLGTDVAPGDRYAKRPCPRHWRIKHRLSGFVIPCLCYREIGNILADLKQVRYKRNELVYNYIQLQQ